MISRPMFLASAALLPFAPAAEAQQAQPTPPAGTESSTAEPPAATADQPMDEYGDEEEIVITGAKPRGSVVGDIPRENTLDSRDVRATGATNISELLDALAPQIGSS